MTSRRIIPRPSTLSSPRTASPPPERRCGDDSFYPPPRYSNLSLLVGSQATSNSSATSPTSVDLAEGVHPRLSGMSLGSQIPSPSYTAYEDDPDPVSVLSSATTFTNPPRYSTVLRNPQAATEGAGSGLATMPAPEYTFDIMAAFRSERWATLRLYDARSTASRGPRKGRHPRFSNMDTMLGNVELHLLSPQTIRSIELTLKGSIITGAIEDGGSTKFLEQGYTLWDRGFGDPRLAAHDYAQASSKYDGKLSGNWIFPFSIPFPTHVDLSTLRVVYPRGSEGPVRFLPEPLHEESPLTPFHLDGGPPVIQPSLRSAPVRGSNITPFDTRTPFMPTEKGRLVLPRANTPSEASPSRFSPTSPSSFAASNTAPLLEPYTLRYYSELSSPLAPSPDYPSKSGRLPVPYPASTASGNWSSGGATSMQDPEPLTHMTGVPLPQSFLERDVMTNVQYEVALTITHGKFSTKSRVSATVIYTPVTLPPSMTLGREIAYRQREVPPGPDLDPDGWKQLPRVLIRGTFNDRQTLTVQYDIFLATPLSYARGTVIPCHLTVSCDDISALNLFANPRTPRVRLRRSIRFPKPQTEPPQQTIGSTWLRGAGQLGGGGAPSRPRLSSTPLQPSLRRKDDRSSSRQLRQATDVTPYNTPSEEENEEEILGSSDEDDEREIGDGAVWCAPASLTQEPRVRRLYGEIHLPRGLQPTCKFPLLNILYHVELLSPATNAFVPDMPKFSHKGKGQPTEPKNKERGELAYISHPVEITTDSRRDEPTPIPFVRVTD